MQTTPREPLSLTTPEGAPIGGRASGDHWPTPAWCTAFFLRIAFARRWLQLEDLVHDPCCGEGAILAECRARGLLVRGMELDPQRAEEARRFGFHIFEVDALALPWGRPEVVITNPPYGKAPAFVERALAERPARGLVAMLLPLTFCERKAHKAILRESPADVYPLPRRPQFDSRGSPRVPHAWWLWQGRPAGEPTRIFLVEDEDKPCQ